MNFSSNSNLDKLLGRVFKEHKLCLKKIQNVLKVFHGKACCINMSIKNVPGLMCPTMSACAKYNFL